METKVIDKSLATEGTQEFEFKGSVLNGFLMLFVNIAVAILTICGIVLSIIDLDATDGAQGGWMLGFC